MYQVDSISITTEQNLQKQTPAERQAFQYQLQKALLLGLLGQKQLTQEQYERCILLLSQRYKSAF